MLPRHLEPVVERSLRHFPVVMLLGPRQCGKSTLAAALAGSTRRSLFTLDDRATLDAASTDPDGFLAALTGPVVLDEVQRAPGLLRALKPLVDRDRKPGRFLLTGSAHLTTMASVAETLAGRAAVHELAPLSWAERARKPSPAVIDRLFSARSCAELLRGLPGRAPAAHREELKARIFAGGYPEPALQRDTEVRRVWFESYRKTYLERDLRELASVQSLPEFGRMLSLVALRTGGVLNASDLGRDAGLSNTTTRRYLGLLQQTFQIALLQPWFANVGKRLVKTPKLYVTDTGLGCHLAAADDWSTLERQHRVGPLVETFVAAELRKLLSLRPGRTHLWYWRVEHGPEVDFLLERGGEAVAVEVKWGTGVARGDLKGLEACRSALGDAFRFGVMLHGGEESVVVGDRLVALPFSIFLGR